MKEFGIHRDGAGWCHCLLEVIVWDEGVMDPQGWSQVIPVVYEQSFGVWDPQGRSGVVLVSS